MTSLKCSQMWKLLDLRQTLVITSRNDITLAHYNQ